VLNGGFSDFFFQSGKQRTVGLVSEHCLADFGQNIVGEKEV
jgi:hypothetical protein